MRAQIVLLLVIAALICLGFTQAKKLKCYSCAYATGSLPGVLEKYGRNPKCADPSGSGMKSLKTRDWVSIDWHDRVFLDPYDAEKDRQPDDSNSMMFHSLASIFESEDSRRPKSGGKQAQPESGKWNVPACFVVCITATGESENEDIGNVTVRGFYATHYRIDLGCTSVGDYGKVCYCDTNECNNQDKSALEAQSQSLSAASGLEVAFGLIAAVEVAMMGKLIC